MANFALKIVPELCQTGKIRFYKLVIDDKCAYDEFCAQVDVDLTTACDMNKIRTYMEWIATTNVFLPEKKYNKILDGKHVIANEFKHGKLRLYVKRLDPNIMILFGGYKAGQKMDVNKLKRLLKMLPPIEELIKTVQL